MSTRPSQRIKNPNINPILVDVPMPIETPRLILRPPQAGDGTLIAQSVIETWDQLNLWMPWAHDKDQITAEFYESWARAEAAAFVKRENLGVLAFCRESGDFIASSGLHRMNWKNGSFEIGYWVQKSKQGQGYASEIANALTRFAFDALDANTVIIGHSKGNDKSQRVIEKLGYESCGFLPNATAAPDGKLMDDILYYRTNTDKLPPLEVSWPASS